MAGGTERLASPRVQEASAVGSRTRLEDVREAEDSVIPRPNNPAPIVAVLLSLGPILWAKHLPCSLSQLTPPTPCPACLILQQLQSLHTPLSVPSSCPWARGTPSSLDPLLLAFSLASTKGSPVLTPPLNYCRDLWRGWTEKSTSSTWRPPYN